jgi:hypothetical protein
MSNYTLKWPYQGGPYNIFSCRYINNTYSLLGSATNQFEIDRDMVPTSLQADNSGNSVFLSFQEPNEIGISRAFKVTSSSNVSTDVVWFNKGLPTGVSSFSGGATLEEDGYVIQVTDSTDSMWFSGAATTVPQNTYLIAWVYLDQTNPPDAIWIMVNDGTARRGYWGKRCPIGVDGTFSCLRVGDLPPTGMWYPLVLPLASIGVVSPISMFGWGILKDRKWDVNTSSWVSASGKCTLSKVQYSTEPVIPCTELKTNSGLSIFPVGLRTKMRYGIYRNGQLIGWSDSTTYEDKNVADLTGFSEHGPEFYFSMNNNGDISIDWGMPLGTGTEYSYSVSSFDENGEESSRSAEVPTLVTSTISRVDIQIDTSSITSTSPTVSNSSPPYVQGNVQSNTYYYRFHVFDNQGVERYTIDKSYTTPFSNRLGAFVLGVSPLG